MHVTSTGARAVHSQPPGGAGVAEQNNADNAWQLVAATFVGLQSMAGLVGI